MLSTEQKIDLIIAGRTVGYAGGDNQYSVKPTIKGAKRFKYETIHGGRPISYEDQYLGEDAFQGWEIVREAGLATCGINYTGHITAKAEEVERMLKFVLREEVGRVRLGIPVVLERWGLIYQLRTLLRKSRLNFTQHETITRNGIVLYSAVITAGGIITLPR